MVAVAAADNFLAPVFPDFLVRPRLVSSVLRFAKAQQALLGFSVNKLL